ncbi:MAG TPA: serine/threonine-protein kinase [Sandaracinaceae bacterium LLY-WYZ-13_1]|nr:serine/threonine-protein kinase [Sandaracinaceae bacterium LLY-WYZ-13_1]
MSASNERPDGRRPDEGGSTHPRRGARRATSIPPGIRSGVLLDDTYRLERTLGEGAMGMVYLGRDRRLERDVAIKFIQPTLVRSDEAHERFLREARTMARVHHVNVVEIYAYGEYMGAPYFVMEYVPGTTVDDWMRLHAHPHLSVDEVIGILDQVCRGVAAIHEAGAVHRDLKPTNVLIGPAFRVCVTDLGLAKVLDKPLQDADKDTVSGTPAYMAPEIVLGTPLPRSLESQADVYSLGVMAFELFTGRLPFQHDSPTDMMLAHADDTPPVPSELRADLPRAFDRVILRALEKDPRKRIRGADELQRELLEARESASTATRADRILVADDDPDFRALIEETLRFAFPDAQIETFPDGAAALEAAERAPASLAVVDLDMPGLNGVELTAAFRATPHLQKTPILVVTATGGAPDWRLLQSLGADGFLVKPIDPVSLIALARRTLDHEA